MHVSTLKPVDNRSTRSKNSKKSRRGSQGSNIASGGIAAALAKGGLHLASGVGHSEDLTTAATASTTTTTNTTSSTVNGRSSRATSTATGRSPFLTSKADGDDVSYIRGFGDDEASARNVNVYDDEDDDEDDEDDSDERSLPVTGFAVASNRRNADFHALFPSVDEGDYLIEGGSLLYM